MSDFQTMMEEAALKKHREHLARVERALVFNDAVWARDPITGQKVIYIIPPWRKHPIARFKIARLRRKHKKSATRP